MGMWLLLKNSFEKNLVNDLGLKKEEAKTVKLIFNMYLAGIELKIIVSTLKMLERKKHTHINKIFHNLISQNPNVVMFLIYY